MEGRLQADRDVREAAAAHGSPVILLVPANLGLKAPRYRWLRVLWSRRRIDTERLHVIIPLPIIGADHCKALASSGLYVSVGHRASLADIH